MKRLALLVFALLILTVSAYAQFQLTSIDYPGGTLTTARGINNRGDIVGSYRITPPRHALLIRRGQFLPLASSTLLGSGYSEAFKTNDRGDVVGETVDDAGFSHGFLLSKGVLTTLDFPTASDTYAFGINNSGVVVGTWDIVDALGNLLAEHGFIWENDTFTEVNFPGSADSALLGINAKGDLVGEWDSDITSPIGHAFVQSKGNFSSFDVPEATLTQADDINDHGQIVGAYIDANGGTHGFLKLQNSFFTLDFPGAAITAAWGINNRGQIVGDYRDSIGAAPHGFIAVLQH